MGWTEIGHLKARQTLYKKYGGEEGYKEELRRRAAKGGKKGGGKAGFATMSPEKLAKVSSKGGKAKRRVT